MPKGDIKVTLQLQRKAPFAVAPNVEIVDHRDTTNGFGDDNMRQLIGRVTPSFIAAGTCRCLARSGYLFAVLGIFSTLSFPAEAQQGGPSFGFPVTVTNPVTLNPNGPNPVTLVTPPNQPAPTVSTQSLDAPGLNPYQEIQTGSNSNTPVSVVEVLFTQVPTGKRRVIQHVSCEFFFTQGGLNGGESLDATLHIPVDNTTAFGDTLLVTTKNGFSPTYIVNSATLFYVEAGSRPAVRAGGAGIGDFRGSCFLSGYDVTL
jgi:hypothetical protein